MVRLRHKDTYSNSVKKSATRYIRDMLSHELRVASCELDIYPTN